MSDKATNYQCPSCTGPLHYDGAAGRLQCDYCGSSFDPAEIEKLYAEKEQQAASQPETGSDTGEWQSSADEDWGTDADKMRVYSCPSCGAQLICEETTAATSCPYCGNPTVIPKQFSGILKPDYIPPSAEQGGCGFRAQAALQGKAAAAWLFRDNNHIEELRGIYMPFWLFDGEAEGSANYMATTTRYVFRHGDTEITETSFTRCSARARCRSAACRWMHRARCRMIIWIPSSRLIMPGLKPFSTAYLPGFFGG